MNKAISYLLDTIKKLQKENNNLKLHLTNTFNVSEEELTNIINKKTRKIKKVK